MFKQLDYHHIPSASEERANVLTHAVGLLLCAVAIPFLIARATEFGNNETVWAVSIFCFGMTMAYLASTLYHATAQTHKLKELFRKWDHISVFLLIGGSYTAVVNRYADPRTSWLVLSIVWGTIALGTVKKIFFTGRFEFISLVMYLGLGWLAVAFWNPVISKMPDDVFWWITAGGISYTSGVVFYVWQRLPYHHAIWHLFVLGGTLSHAWAVWLGMKLA